MRKLALAIIATVALSSAAFALTNDKLIVMFGANTSASSPPLVPCTNQLVLAYNNSCALIAQAWGE